MRLQRKLQPITAINMTPMVDVILQLIIFFMITTTFKTAPGILLELPGSSTAQTVQTSVLKVIAITESEIYVNNEKTDIAGLSAVVKRRAEGGDPSSLKAVLEGDRQVSYQLMISVLDALRRNGIDAVGLRTATEAATP